MEINVGDMVVCTGFICKVIYTYRKEGDSNIPLSLNPMMACVTSLGGKYKFYIPVESLKKI